MADLYVSSLGRGDTVVTLHGGPCNNFIYLADAVRGNSEQSTFVFYDQRGSLLSPVSESDIDKLSLELLVQDLKTLRKSLGQDKMILFGHSWGSLLAMSYYMEYPQHVKGLILSAAMAPYLTEDRPFGKILPEIHARVKKLRKRDVVTNVLKEEGLDGPAEELSPKQQSNRFKITGLASFNMIDLENWRDFKGGGAYYNRKVDSAIGSTIPDTYDIRPVLDKYPIPVTIIQGDKDYIDPAAGFWKGVIQRYEFVKLHVINEASHNSWLDDKEGFDRALKQATTRIKD